MTSPMYNNFKTTIMKKTILALAVALSITACEREHETENARSGLAIEWSRDSMEHHTTIHFCISPYSIHAMTRATLSDLSLTDLWLFDYKDGELQTTIHQVSTDDSFGSMSLSADYGEHTFYFVASRGVNPTISGTTLSWEKPSDTFWQSVVLTVEPQTANNHSVILQRVVTRLRISVTDEVPANLKTLVISPSTWYYGLDYLTGEATISQSLPRSVNVPTSYIGTTNLSTSFYCLCPADGFETDITVSAQNGSSAEIANIPLSAVPFERNRVTSYSGSLFSTSKALTVSASDEWDDDYNVTW